MRRMQVRAWVPSPWGRAPSGWEVWKLMRQESEVVNVSRCMVMAGGAGIEFGGGMVFEARGGEVILRRWTGEK